MTVADVATHQQRAFGAPRCTCKPIGAYHSPMCPVSLFQAAAKLVEFAEELWPDAGDDKIKTDIEKLSEKIKKE